MNKRQDQLDQHPAGTLPQLVCLLNRDGRVTWANRALQRSGVDLHQVLHEDCRDPGCTLHLFWQQTCAALLKSRHAEFNAWDPALNRLVRIRSEMLAQAPQQGASPSDHFAVVTVDEVSESTADKSRQDTSDWLRTEEALRFTRAQLRRLSVQHLTIQESERRRIAMELHDGLGQTLSLVKLSIDEAANSARASTGTSANTTEALERLAPQVKSAIEELRRIAMNLRPSTLDHLGIVATLSWYFREFEAASPEISLERDVSVSESDVPEVLKLSIFRIIQEATGNALKHSNANRLRVWLNSESGQLALSIEDDGHGFDPDAAAEQRDFNHGLGLQTMKERAELSGGRYELYSAPGKGTRISIRWPCTDASDPECGLNEAWSQSICNSASRDSDLMEAFSACLACWQSLGSR